MVKTSALVAFTVIICALFGCSKHTGQDAANAAPKVVLATPPASSSEDPHPHGNAVTPTGLLTPEASDALNFVNRRFVASDCTIRFGTWNICSRNGVLSVAGDRLVMDEDFEEHYSNGPVKKSHETQTVSIADLDADSVILKDANFEGATDSIEVSCKGSANCVKAVGTSADGQTKPYPDHDRLTVSNFSRKDGNEAASYMKRLLALQQGKLPSAIEHEPTEQELVAFLDNHYARTLNLDNGITAVRRRLTVEGDELVETQDLRQYGRQPGQLVVRVNLKDLDELMVPDPDNSGIGLVCKGSSAGGLPNCFFANTGQSSPDHVIMGISDPEEFSKMLKRLIVLHQ